MLLDGGQGAAAPIRATPSRTSIPASPALRRLTSSFLIAAPLFTSGITTVPPPMIHPPLAEWTAAASGDSGRCTAWIITSGTPGLLRYNRLNYR
ncbi:hypothetical protein ACFQX6_06745 [Streptosporangium lutulentum]